jgi:DNA-binding LacI/PurR family transcriptional regulator
MANMKQIAQLAGVSLGTVSHVLNGTVRVREPLQQRVLDAVKKTGYQPNQLARGLRRERTNILAMIIPDILNPFFPGIVRGAEDVAFANGYRLVLCNTDNDHEKELAHLSALQSYLPSGLIVIPSDASDLTVQAEPYRRAGAAVICLDRLPSNWDGDSVTVNNSAGAAEATRHLVNLGHRRIAAITGPMQITSSQERIRGFKKAMRAARLELPPGYTQETSFDRAGGYAKTKILLGMVPRPTAIVAFSDIIALGALMAIHEANLRCPEDISLVGFDGLDLTETTTPQITSVYQSPYQMGAEAATLVLERLKNGKSKPKKIVLQTELRNRASVAAAPKPAPRTTRSRSAAPAAEPRVARA